jgi:hypothetical protein
MPVAIIVKIDPVKGILIFIPTNCLSTNISQLSPLEINSTHKIK